MLKKKERVFKCGGSRPYDAEPIQKQVCTFRGADRKLIIFGKLIRTQNSNCRLPNNTSYRHETRENYVYGNGSITSFWKLYICLLLSLPPPPPPNLRSTPPWIPLTAVCLASIKFCMTTRVCKISFRGGPEVVNSWS
jgi:hypothetical protein